jgi:hypothetical protein
MPKPKRKRISKATARDAALDAAQQSQEGVLGSTQLPRSTSPEEREAFELPDLGALAAKLRRDLDREPDPARRLRLCDLALMELEAARDKGARLYTLQANTGELVNPEDIETYAARLSDLLAKFRLERERFSLQNEPVSLPSLNDPETPIEMGVAAGVPSQRQGSGPKEYPDIMTIPEVAEFLRLKEWRFRQTYRSLGIPFFPEGRFIRFEKADVIKWMRSRKQEK